MELKGVACRFVAHEGVAHNFTVVIMATNAGSLLCFSIMRRGDVCCHHMPACAHNHTCCRRCKKSCFARPPQSLQWLWSRCTGFGESPEAFVFVVPLCARSGRGCVRRRTVLGARRGSGRILRAFGRLQLAFLSLLVCLECYFRPLAAPVIYYPGAHGVPRVAALGGLVWPARAGVNACRARAPAQPCSSCRR